MMQPFPLSLFDTVSLGILTDTLKGLDPDLGVYFHAWWRRPTSFASYRGYYDHLALGHASAREPEMTVGRLLGLCLEADGSTHHGWKGGAYRMTRSTPVWAANPGDVGMRIVGWSTGGKVVLLHVKDDDE